MAFEQPSLVITLDAGADLSGSQYRAVKLSAAQTVNIVTAGTDRAIGILQNKPSNAAGRSRAATIMVEGISKVEAGAAISAGAVIMFDSVGRGITGTATNQGYGIALSAASASGDIVNVLLRTFGTL